MSLRIAPSPELKSQLSAGRVVVASSASELVAELAGERHVQVRGVVLVVQVGRSTCGGR